MSGSFGHAIARWRPKRSAGVAQSRLLRGRVKCTLATRLVNELIEATDKMTPNRTIARYGRVDLLCIDELEPRHSSRRSAGYTVPHSFSCFERGTVTSLEIT